MRSLWRTCAPFIAGGALITGCSDPELKTDLDSEGPPEVTMVTVTHEGDALIVNGLELFEAPTFCNNSADVRVSREVCPTDDAGNRTVAARTDVAPQDFGVRFVFSELLDPNVETLEDRDENGLLEGHIDTTNPVTVTCGAVTMTYDGYYQPSGNDVSTEPGPSIFASTVGFQASTGDACTATLANTVVDKDNNPVTDAALAGPHSFTLAPLHFFDSDPAPGTAGVDPSLELLLLFNAPVDVTTVDIADVTLVDDLGAAVPFTVADGGGGAVLIIPDAQLADNSAYTLTYLAAADIADASASGGVFAPEAADVVIDFETGVVPTP